MYLMRLCEKHSFGLYVPKPGKLPSYGRNRYFYASIVGLFAYYIFSNVSGIFICMLVRKRQAMRRKKKTKTLNWERKHAFHTDDFKKNPKTSWSICANYVITVEALFFGWDYILVNYGVMVSADANLEKSLVTVYSKIYDFCQSSVEDVELFKRHTNVIYSAR